MRLDLFMRIRRDRVNFAIRLRVIAGGAVIAAIILVLTGVAPRYLADLSHAPAMLITPPAPIPQVPVLPLAAFSWPAN